VLAVDVLRFGVLGGAGVGDVGRCPL